MFFRILTLFFLLSAIPLIADDKAPDISKMSCEELENNGVDYLLAQKFDLAQKCFDEMLKRETSKKNPDPAELTIIYYGLGRVFQDKKDIPKAIEYFEKALSYANEKNSDLRILADLYYFAGAAYSRNEQLERALSLENKAIELATKTYGENHNKTAVFLAGNANVYRKMKDYDKSIEQLKKAYSILVKVYGPEEKITQRVSKAIAEVEKEKSQH